MTMTNEQEPKQPASHEPPAHDRPGRMCVQCLKRWDPDWRETYEACENRDEPHCLVREMMAEIAEISERRAKKASQPEDSDVSTTADVSNKQERE